MDKLIVIIKPYSDELGVCWKVINISNGQVIEDGFDSSADAEDWAIGEGMEISSQNNSQNNTTWIS